MDLSEYAGAFEDGYTPDDLERVLVPLSEQLGLRVVCVWDFLDEWGAGGNSDLCIDLDGEARELPDGLWELLTDGIIGDIQPLAGGPHPDIDLSRAFDYRGELRHQYHIEWRNA